MEKHTREKETQKFETHWTGFESPAVAVVESVAAVTGEDPRSMPPLNDAVDADALNRLVQESAELVVRFAYQGQTVTVSTDGTLGLESDVERE